MFIIYVELLFVVISNVVLVLFGFFFFRVSTSLFCFVSLCFICDDVCAQRSTIGALIVLLIDEMDRYLVGFRRKRDGINCILYTVAIGSTIGEINYYDQLLITQTIATIIILFRTLMEAINRYSILFTVKVDLISINPSAGSIIDNSLSNILAGYAIAGCIKFIHSVCCPSGLTAYCIRCGDDKEEGRDIDDVLGLKSGIQILAAIITLIWAYFSLFAVESDVIAVNSGAALMIDNNLSNIRPEYAVAGGTAKFAHDICCPNGTTSKFFGCDDVALECCVVVLYCIFVFFLVGCFFVFFFFFCFQNSHAKKVIFVLFRSVLKFRQIPLVGFEMEMEKE